ncbi:TPA: hypothetical protein DEB72_00650 [Patescibacteria group bacterium]|nr:hypothetical protein [Patescibacteria group bacterium]
MTIFFPFISHPPFWAGGVCIIGSNLVNIYYSYLLHFYLFYSRLHYYMITSLHPEKYHDTFCPDRDILPPIYLWYTVSV